MAGPAPGTPSRKKQGRGPSPAPLTVKLRTAAEMLDLHYDTMSKLLARDVFTAIRAQGYGRGKRVYVHRDEVELFALTRDELAVRNFRAEKGRLPKARAK